jgi:hypothetical protein
MTKVISATPSGRIRRTTARKVQSTEQRIRQLIAELGIDYATYKLQAAAREFSRIQRNPSLSFTI